MVRHCQRRNSVHPRGSTACILIFFAEGIHLVARLRIPCLKSAVKDSPTKPSRCLLSLQVSMQLVIETARMVLRLNKIDEFAVPLKSLKRVMDESLVAHLAQCRSNDIDEQRWFNLMQHEAGLVIDKNMVMAIFGSSDWSSRAKEISTVRFFAVGAKALRPGPCTNWDRKNDGIFAQSTSRSERLHSGDVAEALE